MKWPFAVVLMIVALLFVVTAQAAPVTQEQRPVIAQPEPNAVVRGVVQIVGSATHPQFQRYELYYAPFPVPGDNAWIFIGDAHYQQQPLGLLGTWATGSLPDGNYALRVRVVKRDGNYIDSEPRRVVVANRRAPDTPTPVATNTPTRVPTAPPPTVTVVVVVPTVALPTAAPTAALRPTATPILSGAETTSSRSGTSPTAEVFNLERLLEAARRGAYYTAVLFAAVGAFFAVKAALVWLWHKIRP